MSNFRVHQGQLYPALPVGSPKFAVHQGRLYTVLWSGLPFFVSKLLPVDATDWGSQTFTPSALYTHHQGVEATLEFEADTVNTFDSANLQTDSVAVDDGDRGEADLTLAGRGIWYWRVRAGVDLFDATLSRTATGKRYGLDDFSTGDFATLANNWESLTGTVAIEAGELSLTASGGRTDAYCISKASYSGDQVICFEVTSKGINHRPYVYWKRTSGTEYYWLGLLSTGAAATMRLAVRTTALGSVVLDDATVSWLPDTEYELKIVDVGGTITVYKDGVEVLTASDATHTTGTVLLRVYHATVNTAHAHFDNVSISDANTATCVNLPTGWKLRVNESNTYRATESGGTATVDLLGLALPVSTVEALDYYGAIKDTYTSANDVWGGDAYSVATVVSSTEWGDWAPTLTVDRTSVSIHLYSPAANSDVTTAPQVFQLIARTDDGVQAFVEWETDTVNTFDSPALVQQTTDPDDDGATHEVSQVYLGDDIWYWRAKAVRDDLGADESSWTTILELTVDTGGAIPTGYDPDLTVDIRLDLTTMTLTVSAVVDHALTPTEAATLRLRGQMDTLAGFPGPVTETSVVALGGRRAEIILAIPGAGAYHMRFRTLADYGDDSAWDTYSPVTVVLVCYFDEEPTWERHAGSRVNRVYCPIEGTTTYGTALVAGTPPADEVQVWEPVPAMAVVDADAVALEILTHLRAREISVNGPIPLTTAVLLDRTVDVEYNVRDADGEPVLDESATIAVAKVQYRVARNERPQTHVWLGDYPMNPAEVIAQKIASLERKG